MAQSLRFQAVKQGGPMELVKVPKPVIEDADEVLVNIKATAMQPLFWKMLKYGLLVQKWPMVFGSDGAGVVEAVGSNIKNLKPGDAVLGAFGMSARNATQQEYAVTSEAKLAKKPESLSFEDAAALPVGYIAAVASLYDGLGIALPFLAPYGGPTEGFQPKSVLILGGSSSVGAAAIQLLRIALPKAIILTTSAEKHHDRLKSLGADKAFDRAASIEDIRAATPEAKGVDAIADVVNAAAQKPSLFELLDPAGPKKVAELETGTNAGEIPKGINHSIVRGMNLYAKPGAKGLFEALGQLLVSGQYKVPIETKVVGEGLETIAKAIEELEAGVSGVKLVVKI